MNDSRKISLVDELLETELYEMASSRAAVIANATSRADTLIEHLVKIHGWPDNPAVNGWRQTVRKIAIRIESKRWRETRKPLEPAKLQYILWEEPMEPTPLAVVRQLLRDATDAGLNDTPLHKSKVPAQTVLDGVRKGVAEVIAAITNKRSRLLRQK